MDFTSFKASEISWVVAGLVLAIATFAYPYVRIEVFQAIFPEYTKSELSGMLKTAWEKIFFVCAIVLIFFLDYLAVKVLFVFLHFLGQQFHILGLISFTKNINNGLATMFFLLAIAALLIDYIRERKRRQNKLLATQKLSVSADEQVNVEETTKQLKIQLAKLKEENSKLLDIIKNLSEVPKQPSKKRKGNRPIP